MLYFSINLVRYLVTRFLFAPLPTRMIGLLYFCSSCMSIAIDFSSGTGRRLGRVPKSMRENSSDTSSQAMSSGSSICTAPGFSSSAIRKAFSKIYGIRAPETILVAYLVSGFIIPTTSMI